MSRIKKTIAVLLAGLCLFCIMPVSVFASGAALESITSSDFETSASKKSKKRTISGTFRDASGAYSARYTPYVKFNKNGTFLFKVNLYEGMGKIKGTYKRSGASITCRVTNRDFSGFTGDRVNSFRFTVKNEKTLIYRGGRIGTTQGGLVFKKK